MDLCWEKGGGHWVQQNKEKVSICHLHPSTNYYQQCCDTSGGKSTLLFLKKNSTTVSTQLVGTKAPPLSGQIANHTYDNGSTLVVASQKSEGSFEAV